MLINKNNVKRIRQKVMAKKNWIDYNVGTITHDTCDTYDLFNT